MLFILAQQQKSCHEMPDGSTVQLLCDRVVGVDRCFFELLENVPFCER